MAVNEDIDTGRAWFIMVVSYFGLFFNCLLHLLSGVFYVEYLQKFGEGEAKTSIVGALNVGLLSLTAPIGSMVANKYSSRVSIIIGGSLSATGYITSVFVSSLDWVIVTQGLIVGVGFGLSTTGFFCALGFYFNVWRNTILSMVFSVMGLAAIFAVPFGLFLLRTCGIAMTLSILGCIEANICVLGMICRPSSTENRLFKKRREDNRRNKDTFKISRLFDISLLRNKSFSCFLLSTFSWNLSFAVAVIHFPNYVNVLGGTDFDKGLQMTIFSISNVSGRFVSSLLLSKLPTKCVLINTVSLLFAGILTSAFMLYSRLQWGLYAFTIQLGLLIGLPNSLMTVIPLTLVGVKKLPEVHGFSFLFCGIGLVVGPILLGYIYSLTKSYEQSFVVAGCILIIGSISSAAALLFNASTGSDQGRIKDIVFNDSDCDATASFETNEKVELKRANETMEPLVT